MANEALAHATGKPIASLFLYSLTLRSAIGGMNGEEWAVRQVAAPLSSWVARQFIMRITNRSADRVESPDDAAALFASSPLRLPPTGRLLRAELTR